MGAFRDQFNTLKGKLGVEPQALGVATANGAEVDMQGFEALTFFASLGALGVGLVKIQESDTSGSGFTDVTDVNDFLGTSATPALVQSDVVSIGYVGNKRFVRPVIVLTTGGDVSCPGILGYPHLATVQ